MSSSTLKLRILSAGTTERWLIAGAATVMQIALGGIYAWSVFQTPLMEVAGWTIPQITLTYTIMEVIIGISIFVGGVGIEKVGPRVVGGVAGTLYGLGILLASFSAEGLWLLYLSYGVLAGAGVGLGYIIPAATLVKWFPDRRGLVIGIAGAGFGLGPLLAAPIATRLTAEVGVLQTFALMGMAYWFIVVGAAFCLRTPTEDFQPVGWQPSAFPSGQGTDKKYTLGEALRTWQWYALLLLLFVNAVGGLAILSQAAPMAQEIVGVDPFRAAGLVGLISLANASGRFLAAWLSDLTGRRLIFLAMFLLQGALFVALPQATRFAHFVLLACLVLLCYGGGFATMPAFTADYFGTTHLGSVYGLMVTLAVSTSVVGPLLLAYVREITDSYTLALQLIALLMLLSAIIPFFLRPPAALPSSRHSAPRLLVSGIKRDIRRSEEPQQGAMGVLQVENELLASGQGEQMDAHEVVKDPAGGCGLGGRRPFWSRKVCCWACSWLRIRNCSAA